WNGRSRISARARPPARRRANLCAKRYITYAKASMGQPRRSRRSPSAFPKLAARAWILPRPKKAALPPRRAKQRSAITAAATAARRKRRRLRAHGAGAQRSRRSPVLRRHTGRSRARQQAPPDRARNTGPKPRLHAGKPPSDLGKTTLRAPRKLRG